MQPIQPGSVLPDFDLEDQTGRRYRAEDLSRGLWVLWCYPKDATPGCTRQACALQAELAWFQERGIGLAGLSADDRESHAAFAAAQGLTMPLLADPKHTLSEALGVWGPQVFAGHSWVGIQRSTFVLRDRVVVGVLAPAPVEGHVEALRALIEPYL